MGEDRADWLQQIADEVRNLKESPLYAFRQEHGYSPVIGEGNPHADIMFIGEAPGAQEAKTGRPFVGNAGRVLDDLLASIGLQRRDVYITNVVKDRPPENRDPRAGEVSLYAPFLVRQIEIIRPRAVATLGRFAMEFALNQFSADGKGGKISELHGQVLNGQAPYGDVSIVPLYHPAATFYSEDVKETLQRDFQILKRFA
jgi:DNA polymerase